jgi:hypothetical protein
MELEQRVKTLEYEFKILKNELQRTLLDIQEQVLIHYYPALRSEESGPSDGTTQAFEAVRTKQMAQASQSSPAAPAPGLPVAKKVSLEEIRAAQNESAAAAKAAAVPAGAVDPATMVKLTEWVSYSTATLGQERTGKLLELYSGRGSLAPETKDILLRLASLGKESAPEKVAVNDVLAVLLKLDEQLGRAPDVEAALSLIDEAKLG